MKNRQMQKTNGYYRQNILKSLQNIYNNIFQSNMKQEIDMNLITYKI